MVSCSTRSSAAERGYTALLAQPQILVGVAINLQVGVGMEPSRNFPDTVVSSGWNIAISPIVRWVVSRQARFSSALSAGQQQRPSCWTGGQGVSPYEQKTQQSPGFGRRRASQFGHW